MEALYSFETLVLTRTTRGYFQEDTFLLDSIILAA
jgi:hypothetical protein